MPYPFRRGRTVTITRYTLNQRTRERTPLDNADQPAPVPLCAYDPGSTRENEAGSQVTQSPRFFGPYGLDVRPDDEVSVAGVDGVFEVDGDVLRWRNDLTGVEHCSEVKLRRKRGEA